MDNILVNVVGIDGRDGNQLSRCSRRDGHEDQDEGADGSGLAQKSNGGVGQNQTGRDIGRVHAVGVGREGRAALKSESTQTHGGGAQPGDGEPGESANNVSGEGGDGVSSNGLVVVAIVHEDSAKVANNVDDEEDDAVLGAHGKVRSLGVAFDRVLDGHLLETIVDGGRGAKLIASGIGRKSIDEDDDENDDRVELSCVRGLPMVNTLWSVYLRSQSGKWL